MRFKHGNFEGEDNGTIQATQGRYQVLIADSGETRLVPVTTFAKEWEAVEPSEPKDKDEGGGRHKRKG